MSDVLEGLLGGFPLMCQAMVVVVRKCKDTRPRSEAVLEMVMPTKIGGDRRQRAGLTHFENSTHACYGQSARKFSWGMTA